MKKTFFLLLIILNGCHADYECIEKHQADFRSQALYETVRDHFLDTLRSWQKMNIRTVQQYKETEKWKIDMILMNKKNTYGLIVVIMKGKPFDDANFFGVTKDSVWNFYTSGFPTFSFEQGEDSREFSEISFLIRETLMQRKPSLIINCEVNDEFIEAFFKKNL